MLEVDYCVIFPHRLDVRMVDRVICRFTSHDSAASFFPGTLAAFTVVMGDIEPKMLLRSSLTLVCRSGFTFVHSTWKDWLLPAFPKPF